MNTAEFVSLKERFEKADTEEKINIYVNTEGLDVAQYTALLRVFPRDKLGELDKRLG